MTQTTMSPTPDDPNGLSAEAVTNLLARTPVVATYSRSGFVESVHHGLVVGTDAAGSVVLVRGEADVPIFPRSSNKPIQAVAMLRAGLDLDGELLALASASHNGEDFHREGARRILATVGLDESALQNTPDIPGYEPAQREWLAAGRAPEPLAQNCSGKHAAMLATCKIAGWDTATYRDPEHPLQQLMAQTLTDLTGDAIAAVGIDGCGAPVMAVSPLGLARAFGTMAAAGPESLEGRVAAAMRGYPQWLSGTGRDVADLIRGVPGLIAKDGAEAVYAVGLPDGRGLAVKIADGSQRARTVVTMAALAAMGVEDPDGVLAKIADEPVLGHGQRVGAVAAFDLD